MFGFGGGALVYVSTHSRPKAAGAIGISPTFTLCRFQHTAARRRLANGSCEAVGRCFVSTHSRPKAAGAFGIARTTQGLSGPVSPSGLPKAEFGYGFAFSLPISAG